MNSRKVQNSLSDHFPFMIDINMGRDAGVKKEELTFILRRCFKYFVKSAFLEDLRSQPWDSLGDQNLDVHSKAKIFDKILMDKIILR